MGGVTGVRAIFCDEMAQTKKDEFSPVDVIVCVGEAVLLDAALVIV